MSVIVLGSINVDLVIRSPRLPRPGETVLGGTFYQASGGKGANQAVAAARAGLDPVTFLAAAGDDQFGGIALDNLRQDNIHLSHLKIVAGQPTGIALILVDAAGQNCISVASGANDHFLPNNILALPKSVFQQAKVFLASLESPLETVEAGLRRARDFGLTTILDPAPAPPAEWRHRLLDLADIVTPNEHEAESLTDMPVHDVNSAIAAARQLIRHGPRAAIVTLGEVGAVAVEGDQADIIPALNVQAVDSTAAGDAFNGALAVALAEGKPLFAAAQWATLAAGMAVTRSGAQPSLPRREEIEARS